MNCKSSKMGSDKPPIKILTPVGCVGYGYSTALLYKGIELGATAIICDAGSTDSGPQKLALGSSTVPRESYVRDLCPMVDACFHHRVKVIISSAGGDGSDEHVDDFVDIIRTHCEEKRYNLKLVKIYGGIEMEVVRRALDAKKISPCGSSVPELRSEDVEDAVRIVAQMGVEPYLKAIEEHPDYDIIIAGRSYDPSPYAAYCLANGMMNIATAYHMGKVMECGALCGTPKSREALATVWEDKFEVIPLQPTSICTPESMAAHSLYENAHADLHPGPGGTLDLGETVYVGNIDGSCGASCAKFHIANPYTIKLEGAKIAGFRSIWMGSFRDPILISQIDGFLEGVREHIGKAAQGEEHEINFRVYGKDGTMGLYEPDESVGKEIFLLGEVGAKTQKIATNLASTGRIASIHSPYPGQKATGGNLAMPITPLEIPLGEVCNFNIYHLMEVDDPAALFPYHAVELGSSNNSSKRDLTFGNATPGPLFKTVTSTKSTSNTEILANLLPHGDGLQDGLISLPSLAEVLRSKLAGPFEISFDIIFYDLAGFERAKNSGQLTPEKIAPLYGVKTEDMITCQFFRQAKAFKCTIPRVGKAGGLGDRDLHASQQHVPLMGIRV
jgi:hypothetical protein